MKKLIVCGISLLIAGIANASTSDALQCGKRVDVTATSGMNGHAHTSALLHAIALMEEIEIIGEGDDEGGHYYIIDNGTMCKKVYPVVHTDTPGIVD